MIEFFRGLFTEDLVPHGYCLAWKPEILWLHVGADALIALAYYSIPITLWYFVRRRPDLPFRWVFYLFIAFIFSCGTSHVFEIMTIWKASYGAEGLIKAGTAGISLVTAGLLIPLTPKVLALRSPEELEKLNRELEAEVANRREAEAKLKVAYDDLDERVRQRTAELAAANERLQDEMEERRRGEEERRVMHEKLVEGQRIESLGVLAGGIAHDFNNLLTVILGFSEIARDHARRGESAEDAWNEVMTAARTASDLAGQMLAYSGRGGAVVQALDVSGAIKTSQTLVMAAVPRKVEVRLELMHDLPPTMIDESQFRQAVLNVILNAAEAYGGEAGTIVVRTGEATATADPEATSGISFLESEKKQCVFVEVEDQGGGMDEETQARVFDPFFTTKFAGRGLGLSVVLGAVKGAQGAVQIRSHVGQGTTFRIVLPIGPSAPAPEGTDVSAGTRSAPPASESVASQEFGVAPKGAGELVLVVDDEAAIREMVSAVLHSDGYSVLTATNGAEALKTLDERGGEIALVLMDLTMPVMNGEEALSRLREKGFSQPVILASGYTQSSLKTPISREGFAAFMHKPYRPADMLALIRTTLDG